MSDMLFSWLLICWGAALCKGKETSQIHIIDERHNWSEAESRCKINGSKLYTPGNNIPAWLLKRMQSDTFYWIDITDYLTRIRSGQEPLKEDGHLDADCPTLYWQRNGRTHEYLTSCSGHKKFLCEDENSQIHIIDKRRNWWDAQRRCKVKGGKLYTPDTDIPARLWTHLHSNTNYWTDFRHNRNGLASSSECHGVYKWKNGRGRIHRKPCSEKRNYICEDVYMPTSSSSPDGGFIGLGVGCVLLVLAVLIGVYLLKRQKKLCFEGRDGNQPRHVASAAESITHDIAAYTEIESEAYAVITPPDETDETDGTPASSTVLTSKVRPHVHSDNTRISNVQINDANVYNVLSTLSNSTVPVRHENLYNHLSGCDRINKYKGDYDTANFVPQTEVTTGLKNIATHPRLSDVASGQVFEEGLYNVVGQHDSPKAVDDVTGVYDHAAVDEDDYDTVQLGKIASKTDNSYSHIQVTIEPRKEDTFDDASKRMPGRRASDTCNKEADVGDGRGDSAAYYNTRGVLRDKTERHLEDDNESDGRDQENVYSLAKDISKT